MLDRMIACVRSFAEDSRMDEWRPRPGKVTLRARGGQWERVLDDSDALNLSVVIDEHALDRPVGGLDCQRRQLDR